MDWSECFRQIGEFFSMGGYAFYVWGSYGLALIVMGGEVLLLLKRKKSLRTRGFKATGSDNK